MIFPRLYTELSKVPSSILREGIELRSLSGLSSLKALKADKPLLVLSGFSRVIMSCEKEDMTTKKSIQFHPSERYEVNPMAIHFRQNSA